MTTTERTQARQAPPSRDVQSIVRSIFGGRRGLIAAGAAIAIASLAFNWSWLVAAGIAPVLLSLLPCVAMCALGLCMNRGGSCSTENVTEQQGADSPKVPSADMKGNG
ncbi:hypothetical protein ACFX5Q_29430 [Mesorhizobium sp. IMUNJ 23033]|uniref:hypothetical protein n=1 Tax=Mesorhizobium sp. IMUNJ 23033 TaxID=3378039 RepID=UPI00384E70FF